MICNDRFEIKVLSSLEKVFLNDEGQWKECDSFTMLKGEKYSFQIAMKLKAPINGVSVTASVRSKLSGCISIREVQSVPSKLPTYAVCDDNYITTKAGLFPDVLVSNDTIRLIPGQWRSLWIIVEPDETADAREYDIDIVLSFQNLDTEEKIRVKAEIANAVLPPQKLIRTEWLHCDCIAQYHHTKVFSKRFWTLLNKYIGMAAKYGINMILTPLFTPPLDTAVGGERLTVQLVDVYLNNGVYSFGFEKLKKWIALCHKNNIKYFEFSHLFTQWGAAAAPKIIVKRDDGTTQRMFGWDTPSDSEAYTSFLRIFLKQLVAFTEEQGIKDECYFHVSDEPGLSQIQQYQKAYQLISENTAGLKIIDALSDFDFYEKGIIKKPIPSNDHIDRFIDAKIENLWTYYCCGQSTDVSNRFMAMPSPRNRIIGIQLYKYRIEGFLHWGFNFYNTYLSLSPIDPYAITDGDQSFPSGDPFIVYPTDTGVTESIRLVIFHEAMQDLRALQLLEKLTSREYVLNIIDSSWNQEITFKQYPKSPEYILQFRSMVNREIIRHIKH